MHFDAAAFWGNLGCKHAAMTYPSFTVIILQIYHSNCNTIQYCVIYTNSIVNCSSFLNIVAENLRFCFPGKVVNINIQNSD